MPACGDTRFARPGSPGPLRGGPVPGILRRFVCRRNSGPRQIRNRKVCVPGRPARNRSSVWRARAPPRGDSSRQGESRESEETSRGRATGRNHRRSRRPASAAAQAIEYRRRFGLRHATARRARSMTGRGPFGIEARRAAQPPAAHESRSPVDTPLGPPGPPQRLSASPGHRVGARPPPAAPTRPGHLV